MTMDIEAIKEEVLRGGRWTCMCLVAEHVVILQASKEAGRALSQPEQLF